MPKQERVEREDSSPALLKEIRFLLSEMRNDLADDDNSRVNIVVTRVLFIIGVLLEREKQEFQEKLKNAYNAGLEKGARGKINEEYDREAGDWWSRGVGGG